MPRPGTPTVHPLMLDGIRSVAEAFMNGTGRLVRPSRQDPSIDPVTLQLTEADLEVIWEGPCRYQPNATTDRRVVAGENLNTTTRSQLTLPWAAAEARVDDLWVMTGSNDAAMVGKSFRVIEVAFGEFQAERHLTVEDYETPRRL